MSSDPSTRPTSFGAIAWWRVRAWLGARPGLVDLVIALLLWGLFGLGSVATYAGLDLGPAGAVMIGVIASVELLALAWRRTRPDLSFGLVVGAHLAQLAVLDSPLPSNIAALVSAYAVAAHSRRPWVRWTGLTVAAVAGVLAVLDWGVSDGYTVGETVANVFFFSVPAMLCWLWGDLTRKRAEVLSRLREQNEALRRDRDQRARLAAQDERTRIAREMHDIVAHSLSVVVVQADGAAYAAEHGDAFDREQAQAALTTIGTTAREALAETRRLVGVLRTEDEGSTGLPDYTPTESFTDLPDLVERVAASGIDVTLDCRVDPASVPREPGLAAYRIVQESLTNVIKHAGPSARATVTVAADPDLVIEVTDDGRGAAAGDDGQGHGLIGMRERATSAGGTMTAGPRSGGGYRVRAVLPFAPEESR